MLSSRQNINMILIHTYKFFSLFAPLAISYCQFMTLLSLVVVVSFFFFFFFGASTKCAHIQNKVHTSLPHRVSCWTALFRFRDARCIYNTYIQSVTLYRHFSSERKKTLTINRKHALNSGKRIYYWFAEANAHASHL